MLRKFILLEKLGLKCKYFYKNAPILAKLRLFWLALILLIILFFLCLKIVPLGQTSYTKDYDRWLRSGKGFVYNFTPAERVDEADSLYPKIIGDPVYFSVFTPRTFSRAKLTVVYRDNLDDSTPLIEAGVLADRLVWRYDLQPLENKLLKTIVADWNSLDTESGPRIWQRNNNYESADKFWSDLANGNLKDCINFPAGCLATYNYQFELGDYQFELGNYQSEPSNNQSELSSNQSTEILSEELESTIIDIPLRGAHTLVIPVESENFYLKADFVDLNQDRLDDPIRLLLFLGQDLIIEEELLDENLDPTGGKAEEKSLSLIKSGLKPGIYKLEIKISDDVVIRRLESSSSRLAFANKFWPVSYGQNITLFTDASYLQVKVLDPANLQTVSFGQQRFVLEAPYQQTELLLRESEVANRIVLQKDDIILENNGVFALSADSLINPWPKKIDRHFSLQSEVNYIIANYSQPVVEEGRKQEKQENQEDWKQVSAEFYLKGVYREKGKYNFMISVPGLKAEDNSGRYLEVREVRLELSGRNLWQKIWNIPD